MWISLWNPSLVSCTGDACDGQAELSRLEGEKMADVLPRFSAFSASSSYYCLVGLQYLKQKSKRKVAYTHYLICRIISNKRKCN